MAVVDRCRGKKMVATQNRQIRPPPSGENDRKRDRFIMRENGQIARGKIKT